MLKQIVAVVFGLATTGGTLTGEQLPEFKFAARYSTAAVLLVPSATTDDELTRLLQTIKAARAINTMNRFVPPTTPGGSKGPYAAVTI